MRLMLSVRPRPDADVFLRLEQHNLKTGSSTPVALVDADRPLTGRKTGYGGAIIEAMERESWISSWDLT